MKHTALTVGQLLAMLTVMVGTLIFGFGMAGNVLWQAILGAGVFFGALRLFTAACDAQRRLIG